MDCKTARHVWNHDGGFMNGLRCQMPGLIEHLSDLVAAYKRRDPDPFDAVVKEKAGAGPYRVTHSDGVSQMAQWVHDVLGDQVAARYLEKELGSLHGLPNLQLANICCSGCKVSGAPLADEMNYRIQMAAVNTEPDGSDAR